MSKSPNAGSPVFQEGWDRGFDAGWSRGVEEGKRLAEAEYLASEIGARRAAAKEAVMERLRETLAELDARWENA